VRHRRTSTFVTPPSTTLHTCLERPQTCILSPCLPSLSRSCPKQDSESQVLWWVLQGCDPGAWQPSPQEASSKGDKGSWAKNRSILLRWEALDTALRQVWGGECAAHQSVGHVRDMMGLLAVRKGGLDSSRTCCPAGGGHGWRHAAILAAVAQRALVVACSCKRLGVWRRPQAHLLGAAGAMKLYDNEHFKV